MWAAAAGEHGREVCRDDDNNVDVQRHCLIHLQLLAQREIAAGWQSLVVKFHDFLKLGSDDVGFRSMRYISLLPVIQKFHIRALQTAIRHERKPHETNILALGLGDPQPVSRQR